MCDLYILCNFRSVMTALPVLWVSYFIMANAIIISKDGQVTFKRVGGLELSGKRYIILFEIKLDQLVESITPIGETISSLKASLDEQLKTYELTLPKPNRQIPNLNGALVNNTMWETRDESRTYKSLTPILNAQMRKHLRFLMKDIDNKHTNIVNFIRSLHQYHHDLHETTPRQKRGLVDAGGSLFS